VPDERDEKPEGRSKRPFWSGMLTFGLVSIPVDLYPATRTGGAPLRLLDEDGTPLHRHYYCPEHDTDVPQEHLVRGYELDDGRYVTVTDDELEAVDPKKSREIDLRLFAPEDSIDPMFFEHAYFLAPGAESGKAYRLLASVMERTKRAGIATFVMRDREYLVAVLPDNGLLRAETLRFHDEVRSPRTVGIPKARKAPAALVKKFEHAIAELQTKRLPTAELTDEHSERIEDLAHKKHRRGEDLVRSKTPSEKPEGADVIDLMEALKRSLKGARGRSTQKKRGARGAKGTTRTSRARRAR
jgi:DNA end-binding protein Ku